MVKELEIWCSPSEAADGVSVKEAALNAAGLHDCVGIKILKRSLDARRGPIKYRLKVQVFVDEPVSETEIPTTVLPDVSDAQTVHIVGCGPAGLFAALECVLQGRKPVLIERGKQVRARRRDVAKLNREHLVDEDSNYCFGEGGAGTFSDGKLYTRSHKRGRIEDILKWLVAFGAPEDILIDSQPHIGTNKLPAVITNMRECIEQAGGEFIFESRMTDLAISDSSIRSITINDEEEIPCSNLILATGHSARDIFHLLHRKGLQLESKDIAIGVRIEHPQALIDRIQYRMPQRGEHLPPASYKVVEQVSDCGVYSFCMCPGGVIAPCATAPEEIVTNGWSPSKRNNPFANSGLVVQMSFAGNDPLGMLNIQQEMERKTWASIGSGQTAPAQRLTDLMAGRNSHDLPACSYLPGVEPYPLHELLDASVLGPLKGGLERIGKKLKGYLTNEAVAVAIESRTSSPVRIPRDRTTYQHPQVSGLYPCGEGAGYAGGIVSAAMDGIRCAKACVSR